ncbi:cobalt-zinc-cadmium efflux system outer membrane protein [Thermoflavifilum aggregans]|uniref:Cobalt-zinc-cadmium efflux system outer membrane protein n=1 Tax=Thermoflavifilum aggregans TaxID=454188 RepID=A0A2M9CV36_9BACT|nr:TolC family protein [Thermoflavifilum aggregans]PJJ75777.1 cobalt-zinc-cadmium efflux system outer membrane protein [Thermoflavifilum aggregans]
MYIRHGRFCFFRHSPRFARLCFILSLSWLVFTLPVFSQSLPSESAYQDTLRLQLAQADSMFLQNNLELLAQQYQVDAARAAILQAKLWNNPNLSISQGLYDPSDKKWFDLSSSGETAVQLQQLILLAGKRNKQILIARDQYQWNVYAFFDLMRTLRYTLHTDLFQLYYAQQSINLYTYEIQSFQRLVRVLNEQYQKGFAAKKEVLRLQAQLLDLQNQLVSIQQQIADLEAEVGILLRAPRSYVIPELEADSLLSHLDMQQYALTSLIDTALNNRADLRMAEFNLKMSQHNEQLQKALAVPDLTLAVGYDKNGNYVPNANLISAGFDIPLFNRNQGNIQAARSLVQYQQTQFQQARDNIVSEVTNAYQQALQAQRLYQSVDTSFYPSFQHLLEEVNLNYQHRNISMLELLDMYDAYKQAVLDYQNAQLNRLQTWEKLNYVIGRPIFH